MGLSYVALSSFWGEVAFGRRIGRERKKERVQNGAVKLHLEGEVLVRFYTM